MLYSLILCFDGVRGLNNYKVFEMENESFVEKMMLRLVIDEFRNKRDIPLDPASIKRINCIIVEEYMNEFYGKIA